MFVCTFADPFLLKTAYCLTTVNVKHQLFKDAADCLFLYVCLSDTYIRNKYVCTCVRGYVNAYLRTDVRMYLCMYLCMYVCPRHHIYCHIV